MTKVTRAELEACARLLGDQVRTVNGVTLFRREYTAQGGASFVDIHAFEPEHNATDLLALARAANLRICYDCCFVELPTDLYCDESVEKNSWRWPADGTEAECIIKAAAAVQIEREI